MFRYNKFRFPITEKISGIILLIVFLLISGYYLFERFYNPVNKSEEKIYLSIAKKTPLGSDMRFVEQYIIDKYKEKPVLMNFKKGDDYPDSFQYYKIYIGSHKSLKKRYTYFDVYATWIFDDEKILFEIKVKKYSDF